MMIMLAALVAFRGLARSSQHEVQSGYTYSFWTAVMLIEGATALAYETNGNATRSKDATSGSWPYY